MTTIRTNSLGKDSVLVFKIKKFFLLPSCSSFSAYAITTKRRFFSASADGNKKKRPFQAAGLEGKSRNGKNRTYSASLINGNMSAIEL